MDLIYTQAQINALVGISLLAICIALFIGIIIGARINSKARDEEDRLKHKYPYIASRHRHSVMFGQQAGRN
jgi:uncharacterized protein YneF (UPF0154 family)